MALVPATSQDIQAAKQRMATKEEPVQKLVPATMADIQAAKSGISVPKEQLQPASARDLMVASQKQKSQAFDVVEALPETLKLGFSSDMSIDTGIPLSKGVSSALVGAGHMLQNTVMGAGQLLGLVDEEEQNYKESAMNALYRDPDYGKQAIGGAIVGGLAEPVGFLAPSVKGKKLWDIAKIGAATGFVYGGLDYTDPEENRLMSATIGAIAGGTITPAVVKAYRMVAPASGKMLQNSAEETLKELEYKIAKSSGGKIKPDKAVAKAYEDMGLTTDQVAELVTASGRSEFNPKYFAYKKNRASVIEDFEMRSLHKKSWWNRKAQSYAKAPPIARNMAENTFTPIQQAVKDVDEAAGYAMRKSDFIGLKKNAAWLTRIETNGIKSLFKKLPGDAQEQFKYAVYNSNRKTASAIMRQHFGNEGVAALDDTYKLQDEIYDDMKRLGYDIPKLDNYWHREVVDPKIISKIQRNQFSKALAKQKQKLGRELTPGEVQKLHERYIMHKGRYAITSGALKERTVQHIGVEELAGYDDPISGLEKMFLDHSEDISRREFFRSLGWTPPKGAKVDGSDIDDAISHFLSKLKITDPDEAFHIQNVLRARYVDSREPVHKVVQVMKNLSYASTLGNFKSALTQIGDVVIPMQRYGIARTVKSAVRQILGRQLIKREDIGILDAAQELAEHRSISKLILDKSMKYGWFNAYDRFGKEVGMDAAVRSAYKLLKSKNGIAKFKSKYGSVLGGDIDKVIKEIPEAVETKKLGDGVLFFAFNEITDYQPLTRSEVPANFWKGQGLLSARLFYAYKTFSIKQFNYIRTNMIRKIRSDNWATRREGIKELTTFLALFLVVNGSIDQAKQALFGKGDELDAQENAIHNFLSIFGASQFTQDKLEKGSWWDAAWEIVKPVPIEQTRKLVNDLGESAMNEDSTMFVETLLKHVPVVNKLMDASETMGGPGATDIVETVGN